MLVFSVVLPITIVLIGFSAWFGRQSYRSLSLAVQRLTKEKEVLQNLFPAMAQAASVEAALEIALREICQRTGWVAGEAWIPSEDDQSLRCEVWHCNATGNVTECSTLQSFEDMTLGTTFARGEGLPGRVWVRGQVEWLQDVSQLQSSIFKRNISAEQVGFKAALGVPIQHQGKVLAILVFFMTA